MQLYIAMKLHVSSQGKVPNYSAWLNADMRSWVLQSFGVMESSPEGNKARPSMPAITIIDRGPAPVARRIINQDMLAAAAAKVGRVQVVRLQDISFEEQLQLMLSTDVMIAAHGSAVSMMVFLPPQAVVVEVKAYKHGLTQDFTHGHCNLARATDTSLLVWHNRQLEHTRRWEGAGVGDPFYKTQHTYIPDADIDLILDSALQTWHTPVSVRNFNDVWFLNSAETLS